MRRWECLAVSSIIAAISAMLLGGSKAIADGDGTQDWNFHFQNTDIVQGDPAFSAKYSGPNSLDNRGEVQHAETLDLFAGLRLWNGAEIHIDGQAWNGFGLSSTLGVDDYPNGAASKVGTDSLDFSFTRIFIRQTIGLGGPQEDVPDGELSLAGKQDVSRLTFTFGRFAATDIFDTNSYAGDPLRQFMNWAFITNTSWDYPADSIGYTTGFSAELNQPGWTLRYGFFQMPGESNELTAEDQYLTFPKMNDESDNEFWKSWGMAGEFERRYSLGVHPGAVRLLAWLNEANMGSYEQALSVPGVDIAATREYRFKYGFGLNWEQEIFNNVGVFSRLGWNDGREEAWAYTDVNYSASIGLSVKGEPWHRPDDTIGLAAVFSGISHENKEFLEAGGTGILDGDGALNYGWEKVVEAYYDVKLWESVYFTVDYQFVDDPAFNRDRGPVSILAARVHWEF
jgi:high affinity Mn2+ porin